MATQYPASFDMGHSGVERLSTITSPEKDPVDRADSGYGSSESTPDGKSSEIEKFELEHKVSRQLFSRFRKTKLRPFDQEISQAVQNRFSDLTELFGPSLYTFLVKRRVRYNAISIKLKVLGKDERSARPWVVVQCDEAASKPIKHFFDQPEVKTQYRPGDSEPDLPSFDVVIHPRAPVSLATSHPARVYGNSWADIDTLCGKIIKIGSLDEPHIATLGGVIKVETSRGEFLLQGLTAGHIIPQEPVTGHDNGRESPSTYIYTAHSSCETTPTHLEPGTQKVEDGLVHDVCHPQEQEDAESATGSEVDGEDVEIDLAVEIDKATKGPTSFQDSSLDNTTQDSQEQSWSMIGSIYSTSRDVHARPGPDRQSGPDQDWALVNIDRALYRPNLLADQPSGANIVELTELSGGLDKSEGSRAVVLVSGVGGLKRGSLSLSPSFLMLGQAKSFTKTYNLVLHDVPGPNIGDSGSWVVDEQSYGVYGHLVASDAFAEAYVVPFDKILLDIKHSLGAVSICLPSRSDISNWRQVHDPEILMGSRLPKPEIRGHSGSTLDSGYASVNPSPPVMGSRLPGPGLKDHSVSNPDSGYASVNSSPQGSGQVESFRPSTVTRPDHERMLRPFDGFEHPRKPVPKPTSVSIEPEQPVLKRSSGFRRRLKSLFRKTVYKPKAESKS